MTCRDRNALLGQPRQFLAGQGMEIAPVKRGRYNGNSPDKAKVLKFRGGREIPVVQDIKKGKQRGVGGIPPRKQPLGNERRYGPPSVKTISRCRRDKSRPNG